MVLGTNNKPNQTFDKQDVCFYCKMTILNTSLVDHLTRRHNSEDLVHEITQLPKGDKKKRKLLQVIRNKGNFEHNQVVLKHGGNLIVAQRPSETRDISDNIDSYVACSRCYGLYNKNDIYRHACPVVQSGVDMKKLLPSRLICSNEKDINLSDFFRRMHDDHVTSVAKSDESIREFVTQEIDCNGIKAFNTIANKVRLLSEFLIEARKYLENKSSLLDVMQNVGCVKDVVKHMFQYNTSEEEDVKVTIERPSSAIRLKQTLDKVAVLLHIRALKASDWDAAKQFERLPMLLNYDLEPICKNARKSMKCSTSGLPQSLPEADTINALVKYLDDNLQKLSKVDSNRRTLSELALARVIIFNKRRSGEVAKITVRQWEWRNRWKNDVLKDADSLDETEKLMVQMFDLLYVNGKGNRYVPVIIPPIVTSTMQWLRETSHNRYVFCNQTSGHIRGHDALRRAVKDAKIKSQFSEDITSTKFRKLSATTLQVS